MTATLLLLIRAGLAASLFSAGFSQAEPIKIPAQSPCLFLDDTFIDAHANLRRTLRAPSKDQGGELPVIALENEFEGYPATLEANGTIVFDPKLEKYVMFALGYATTWREKRTWDCARLYRFTSVNGLDWIKGEDGTPQCVWPRSPEDLLDPESGASATNIDTFSCYYDVADPEWPYKGWNHFANWGFDREGVHFMRSRDGITWHRGPMVVNGCGGAKDPSARRFVLKGHHLQGPGDVTLFSHDPLTNRFLGLFKFYAPEGLPNGNLLRSRAYAWLDNLTSPFDTSRIDEINLLPAGKAENGDLPADEYYSASAWRYGGGWLGGLKIFHDTGDYPWSAAGCAFLKLAFSHDGLHWKKVPFANDQGVPEVWLANGAEGGNAGQNDGGYMTEFSQGPLRIGDELVYYYASSSFGKNAGKERRISGGGVFRARMRPDGFVSVDSGTLTTPPLEIEGGGVLVNAAGPVTVEVLGADATVQRVQELQGDSLGHALAVDQQPFRLRFTIQSGGSLYAFCAQ